MKSLFTTFTKTQKGLAAISIMTNIFINIEAYIYCPTLLPYTSTGIINLIPLWIMLNIMHKSWMSIDSFKLTIIINFISLLGATSSLIYSLYLHTAKWIIIICIVGIILHIIGILNMYVTMRIFKGDKKEGDKNEENK